MSTDTDDLGNPKVPLSDGSALFALPYQSDKAAKSLIEDIGKKTDTNIDHRTPDPTSDEADQNLDPHEDGGPLRRFNDIKSPLGSVGLESLAKDEDEVAKAISARSDEVYRNEFPVIVPKFGKRCEHCGAEFEAELDEDDPEPCAECGHTDFETPDFAERRVIKERFESVNKEGQSMRQVGKVTDEDHSRLGVLCWVLRWNYLSAPRDVGATKASDAQRVVDVRWNELVRGDPKRIVPVVDADGRVGGVWWTCPFHRQESVISDERHREGHEHCPTCGCDLREVHYVERAGAARQDIEKYYFAHEIVMFAGHIPQPHGLDGLSPVHLVWLEQAILHWMDVYAAEYFNPHSERTPNKFLIVHTTNPESFEEQLDEAKQEAQANPYKSGIFYNRMGPDQGAQAEAQVIDVMGDEFLGQSDTLRKRYENHIRTVFGVTDVFDSELEDAGGLNNEGLQLEVTDRSIAAAQQDYSDGPYDELLRYWGFEDWRVQFVPPREQDVEERIQAVKLLRDAAEIGLPARMENGEPVIGDGEAEAPAQGGPMGGEEPPPDGEPEGGGEEADFSNPGAGMKQSPVPDNAIRVSDPSQIPDDAADSGQGPQGGWWYVPAADEGGETDTDRDLSDIANDDGTIDAEDLEFGDKPLIHDEPVTIQGVEADEHGTLVAYETEDGESFMVYEDLIGGDIRAPGAEPTEAEPDTADEPAFQEGDTLTTPSGGTGTVVAFDSETGVVAYENDEGEELLATVESVTDEPEPDPDSIDERVSEATGVPIVNTDGLDDESVDTLLSAWEQFEETQGIPEMAVTNITTTPPEDASNMAGASYTLASRTLYINPDGLDPKTEDFEEGWIATESAEGTVHHELAHAKHLSGRTMDAEGPSLSELREMQLDEQQAELVEEEVSWYASTSPIELVAEVFSGRMEGHEYSDDVMDLYEEFGGPEVNA